MKTIESIETKKVIVFTNMHNFFENKQKELNYFLICGKNLPSFSKPSQ